MKYENIEKAIKDLKEGKMILVMDDEDRENEGDIVCSAENISVENMNFMATYAKGLICLPMSKENATRLQLEQMVLNNTDNHETAFTVSIDYKDVTTGISAYERALTAKMCAQDNVKADDFRKPGHMFPLVAKDGGVLIRNGHTEATVDLMKLANLKECGLCCEIMDDDGSMKKGKQLDDFAKKFNLTSITIQELQHYKKVHDKLVECVSIVDMPTKYGNFKAHTYINILNNEHHIALVKGDISNEKNVLCRVHSECLTGDVFHSLRCDCGAQLEQSMKIINDNNSGVLLYMRQEGRGIGLVNKLKAYQLQEEGLDTLEANLALGFKADEREYYIGAQILKDLKIKNINLLTNNLDKVYQLEEFDIHINKRIPIEVKATIYDLEYLKTKKNKMNHILNIKMEEL
ncbi:3,4-dihydroxy-2-butanone-4-phosphate synthase [Mycoplasma sp. P36-A1]|uniref:3,4-dihydroxy-2-butanone-4-phosphate synthase n=1 Tax=Mycoplasma sp. P36-A1 TaxID=3252900 RepID=UPI003C2EBA75